MKSNHHVVDESRLKELTRGGRTAFDEYLQHVVSAEFVEHQSQVARQFEAGANLGAFRGATEDHAQRLDHQVVETSGQHGVVTAHGSRTHNDRLTLRKKLKINSYTTNKLFILQVFVV